MVWPHLLWLLNFPERHMVAADMVRSWSNFTHLSLFRLILVSVVSVRDNLFSIADQFELRKL